jgi:hypothetical protein
MYGYGPRVQAGFSPYLAPRGRGRVGAPLLPASGAVHQALAVLGQFATAQGGNPALISPAAAAMRGTRQPLPFPAATLAGTVAASATSSTTSQGVFRPSRLIVVNTQDATGASIAITAMFVGSESCLVNNNPLTTALFQPTGVECGITFPTAGPGITISITFGNVTTTTTTVFPAMLGEYVQGGGPEIGG